jgi:hypothetical protein
VPHGSALNLRRGGCVTRPATTMFAEADPLTCPQRAVSPPIQSGVAARPKRTAVRHYPAAARVPSSLFFSAARGCPHPARQKKSLDSCRLHPYIESARRRPSKFQLTTILLTLSSLQRANLFAMEGLPISPR